MVGAGAVVVGLFVLASCLTRNANLPPPTIAAYNAARDAEPAGPGIAVSPGAPRIAAQTDCGGSSTPAAAVNATTLEGLPWSVTCLWLAGSTIGVRSATRSARDRDS